MINKILVLDFETFYSKDYSLRNLTPPEYILDNRFQVLLLAVYDLTWPAPKVLLPHEIEPFLKQYPPEETLVVSHNALFDMSILSWRYGWVPARMVDTLGMVRALRNYKRNSLGAVAKELFGFDSKGDTVHKVAGLDTQGIKNKGLWPQFCTYAMNDARICAQIYLKLLPEFPVEEQKVMDLVLRCAVEPKLQVDNQMLQQHLNSVRKEKFRLLKECGYDKAALMSTAQFKQALEDLGVEIKTKTSGTLRTIPAFAKTDPFMSELATYDQADEDTNYRVQTLAMARLSHRSTIEETRAEKFLKISNLRWEGCRPLLPVALRYGGAHTHRLSGEWRLNMQNLPRDKLRSKLRTALVAPAGYKLITADLAQIEARIVACLCGQDSMIDAFKQGDVYSHFASVVFRQPVSKKTKPEMRFIGKTAILGLGYGCGHERFYQMVTSQARQYDIGIADIFSPQIAKATVDLYRLTFSRIKNAWSQLDQLLANVINSHNQNAVVHWGPVTIRAGRIELPNGMALRYQSGDQSLYGAKILENVTQALARIVVMQAAVRLANQGLRFVLQSHDELVFVVRDNDVKESSRIISEEMTRAVPWLPKLPLAVEIGVGQNYGEAK